MAHIHNQHLSQIETLRRAKIRDSDAEESHAHPLQPHATNTDCTGGSQRHPRSACRCHEECFDESETPKLTKASHVEDLVEMVRKRIQEDKPQSRGGLGSFILQISDSPLSDKIMSHHFSKKFVIPSFDYYTGVTDPVQHYHRSRWLIAPSWIGLNQLYMD